MQLPVEGTDPVQKNNSSEFSYNLSTNKENDRSNVSATTVAFIRDEYKNQNLNSENALSTDKRNIHKE